MISTLSKEKQTITVLSFLLVIVHEDIFLKTKLKFNLWTLKMVQGVQEVVVVVHQQTTKLLVKNIPTQNFTFKNYRSKTLLSYLDANMIQIKTININTQNITQTFFPFFLLTNCKCNIAASTITNTQLQHSKHQQFQIHKCKTTNYQVSLFKDLFSHYYHMFHFLLTRYLLFLLPITYYLLYFYLFPGFLFPYPPPFIKSLSRVSSNPSLASSE